MQEAITFPAITVSGFKLNYIIEGQGMPALVVGSSLYYQRVFSASIKERLQFILVDHRGFVPPPSENLDNSAYGLDVLIEDIEQVRKELGLENFVIIGHSGHAFMALEYAKKYPGHVLGVVMIGVTPDYSARTHKAAELFFEKEASPEKKQKLAQNMNELPQLIAANPQKRFMLFCLAAGPKSWLDDSFDAAPLWEGVFTNMQMIDYVWGEVFRDIDITNGLNNFDKPVLLALGKYDFLTGPTELWEPIKGRFKDLTIEIFEKSAHSPQLEEAEAFNETLLMWLARFENKTLPTDQP